jgi:hypothetical protein
MRPCEECLPDDALVPPNLMDHQVRDRLTAEGRWAGQPIEKLGQPWAGDGRWIASPIVEVCGSAARLPSSVALPCLSLEASYYGSL